MAKLFFSTLPACEMGNYLTLPISLSFYSHAWCVQQAAGAVVIQHLIIVAARTAHLVALIAEEKVLEGV